MSDKITWTNITKDNLLDAIEFFDNKNPDYMNPKGLFLIYNNKKYPAKTIRKLAYNIKNDVYINEDMFKGGSYTVKFFNNMGFDMEYNNQQYYVNNHAPKKHQKNKKTDKESIFKSKKDFNSEKIIISTKRVLEQKNALQLILNDIFNGDIVIEKSFEWMRTPKDPEKTYPELFNAIKDYRGYDKFARSNYLLQCDFVSESNKVIIEYDERQHFTQARRESLLGYPDIELNFDKNLWIKASDDIRAVDNTPKDRDETRAYYDSIRDLEAYNHGYKLIRIMHDEYDFESDGAYEYVEKLIKTYVPNIKKTNTVKMIVDLDNVSDKVRKSAKFQKNALQLLLNRLCDYDLICEKPYDWMRTPENPKKYAKIYNALVKYNGGNISAKNNYRLHCDFVCESKKLIIEYDERAHFTEAREISLLNYPDIELNYDKNHWIKSCQEIKAKIDSKHNSTANRAYYDSIRDIEAYNHAIMFCSKLSTSNFKK